MIFFPYKKTTIKKFYPKLINRKNLRGTIFSCGRFAIEKWLRLCICWNLITFNIFVNITFTKNQGYIKIILQYVGPFYILISILKNLIDFQRKIMSVYRQRFNIQYQIFKELTFEALYLKFTSLILCYILSITHWKKIWTYYKIVWYSDRFFNRNCSKRVFIIWITILSLIITHNLK